MLLILLATCSPNLMRFLDFYFILLFFNGLGSKIKVFYLKMNFKAFFFFFFFFFFTCPHKREEKKLN
jgi:hypothetical protein